MTPAATAGELCDCGACRVCAIAAVANGAKWTDPFGTGRPVPGPNLIVRKPPAAVAPGLFDEPTVSEG